MIQECRFSPLLDPIQSSPISPGPPNARLLMLVFPLGMQGRHLLRFSRLRSRPPIHNDVPAHPTCSSAGHPRHPSIYQLPCPDCQSHLLWVSPVVLVHCRSDLLWLREQTQSGSSRRGDRHGDVWADSSYSFWFFPSACIGIITSCNLISSLMKPSRYIDLIVRH